MHTIETNRLRIPALGLGTFRLQGDVATRIVAHALATGYRHIDTAQMYGNEAEVGAAVAKSAVAREQIWITTKVWPDRYRHGELQRSAEESARRLRTEPDLLLLHWPNPGVPLHETLGALNEVKRRGLTRSIGISNFTSRLIAEACALSPEPLIANQVEYHPYLDQGIVLDAVRARQMALIAYSPVAQGRVFDDPELAEIGLAHGKTAGQVALRWLVQQPNVAAIPRSSSEQKVEANLQVFDFKLSAQEMSRISARARKDGRLVSPAGLAPDWD